MQKHVNLVDLVKSFPTNIYLQNLASIQKRTSLVKFAHLAEKSGKTHGEQLAVQPAAFCVASCAARWGTSVEIESSYAATCRASVGIEDYIEQPRISI